MPPPRPNRQCLAFNRRSKRCRGRCQRSPGLVARIAERAGGSGPADRDGPEPAPGGADDRTSRGEPVRTDPRTAGRPSRRPSPDPRHPGRACDFTGAPDAGRQFLARDLQTRSAQRASLCAGAHGEGRSRRLDPQGDRDHRGLVRDLLLDIDRERALRPARSPGPGVPRASSDGLLPVCADRRLGDHRARRRPGGVEGALIATGIRDDGEREILASRSGTRSPSPPGRTSSRD